MDTEKEYQILMEKIKNPKKEVQCPRCGGRILYKDWGSGNMAWCEKGNCSEIILRGI